MPFGISWGVRGSRGCLGRHRDEESSRGPLACPAALMKGLPRSPWPRGHPTLVIVRPTQQHHHITRGLYTTSTPPLHQLLHHHHITEAYTPLQHHHYTTTTLQRPILYTTSTPPLHQPLHHHKTQTQAIPPHPERLTPQECHTFLSVVFATL